MNNFPAIKLGSEISRLRKSKNMTQVQLAEIIDVTNQYISDLERDIYAPSFEVLIKIIIVLNLSLDKIMLPYLNSTETHDFKEICRILSQMGDKNLRLCCNIISAINNEYSE